MMTEDQWEVFAPGDAEESRDEPREAEVRRWIRDVTSDGLFFVAAYAYEMDGDEYGLLTTNYPDLPTALRVIDETVGRRGRQEGYRYTTGRYLRMDVAERLQSENVHLFKLRCMRFPGVTPREFGDAVRIFSPSLYPQMGFALVDLVGFTTRQDYQQLQMLRSLDLALEQCTWRSVGSRDPRERAWGKTSTGDGFYFFPERPRPLHNVRVLRTLLLMMAQLEYFRRVRKLDVRLKGAFTVGMSYTFYERDPEYDWAQPTPPHRQMLNAVGPATNDLARVMAKAQPGQLLITQQAVEYFSTFTPGFLRRLFVPSQRDLEEAAREDESAEEDAASEDLEQQKPEGVELTPALFLTDHLEAMAQQDLVVAQGNPRLPEDVRRSLSEISPDDIRFEFSPERPFRIPSKHEHEYYHAWNLVGTMSNWDTLVRVGVEYDDHSLLTESRFVTPGKPEE
jgi:hypothetical protein